MRVPAFLTITAGPSPALEPVDVAIEARPGADGAELSILLETGTEWVVSLDAAAAAYVSGALAAGAGVKLEGRCS